MYQGPVVGVGALGRGTTAVQTLLESLPEAVFAPLVVVQQLEPGADAQFDAGSGAVAGRQLREAVDGETLVAGIVYLVPPGRHLQLRQGRIHLLGPEQVQRTGTAIDGLFRSLASDCCEGAIAIVLGDAGVDCIEGLKAVRAQGGLTLVQARGNGSVQVPVAEYDALELSDLVLPVTGMGAAVADYLQRPGLGEPQSSADEQMVAERLDEILEIIHHSTGSNFRHYKPNTLVRRIQRRMGLAHRPDLEAYIEHLAVDPGEAHHLCSDLLINITQFFRQPEVWALLRDRIIPEIVAAAKADGTVRAWVPGCSTGEEAYTLAMLLSEELKRRQQDTRVLIFASDIAAAARERAGRGIYPLGIAADVPPDLLKRYFTEEVGGYRIANHLREMVVFSDHNLLTDPPFSRLDIITCRNLLIYLRGEVQQSVLRLFHFALNQRGYLILGGSESLGGEEQLFIPVSKVNRVFRRRSVSRRRQVELPPLVNHLRDSPVTGYSARSRRGSPPTLDGMVNQMLAATHAPPSVLIDHQGRILYLHGDTSGILKHPAGEPTQDLLLMLPSDLRVKVRLALRQARSSGKLARQVLVSAAQPESRIVVTAQPLPVEGATEDEQVGRPILISFQQETATVQPALAAPLGEGVVDRGMLELEEELTATRRDLQEMIAELEDSNHRHRSQHEEIMSMNEELQSTNEELETSKEELQSLNEELNALNAQLEVKLEELEVATDDLVNLLAASDIATVFLDQSLHIKRFTPRAFGLLNLRLSDVGRPIHHVSSELGGADLVEETRAVLRYLQPRTNEISTADGMTYLRRVQPYKTDDQRVAGVVITFSDVSELKQAHRETLRAKAEAEAERSELRDLIMRAPACIALHQGPTHVFVLRNQLHQEVAGNRPCIGLGLATAFPEIVEQGVVALYDQVYASGEALAFDELPISLGPPDQRSERWLDLIIKPMLGPESEVTGVMTLAHDVTGSVQARRQVEALTQANERELEKIKAILEAMTEALIITDGHGMVQLNRAAREMYGLSEAECEDHSFVSFSERFQIIDGDGRVMPMERWAAARALAGETFHEFEAWVHDTGTGRKWYTSTGGTVVHDAEGRVRFSILCIRDATSEREAKQRLYERNQDLSNFASVASHDLQAPLRLVHGYLELLMQSATERLSEPEQGYLDQVLTASGRMRQMVDGLLGYARLSADAKITVEPVEANEALEAALANLQPVIEERQAVITIDPLPQVLCKSSLLIQTFQNLLANAFKFCHCRPEIRISSQRMEEGCCRITVSDNGPGIPPEHHETIFGVFNRLDHTASGCGIGLAFCRRMATISGGRIWVESPAGGGASFHLELPCS